MPVSRAACLLQQPPGCHHRYPLRSPVRRCHDPAELGMRRRRSPFPSLHCDDADLRLNRRMRYAVAGPRRPYFMSACRHGGWSTPSPTAGGGGVLVWSPMLPPSNHGRTRPTVPAVEGNSINDVHTDVSTPSTSPTRWLIALSCPVLTDSRSRRRKLINYLPAARRRRVRPARFVGSMLELGKTTRRDELADESAGKAGHRPLWAQRACGKPTVGVSRRANSPLTGSLLRTWFTTHQIHWPRH
jgi:hypothetical protein